MTPRFSRRQHLLGTLGLLAGACSASRKAGLTPLAAGPTNPRGLPEVEASLGGRLGVFALDTGTGRELSHRPDERFAMASTFKWVLAATVLAEVDRGAISLSTELPFTAADLLEYAPVVKQHAAAGVMTVDALAQAAVTLSDNTAANLLLAKLGGPPALTRFARAAGDAVTRLDRTEPALNENAPGDERDTTSPRAMVGLLRSVLLGNVLSPASRDRLTGWMRACETCQRRLRAGFPPGWVVGDKTGSGHDAINDVAIATPPGRAPILVASYISGSPLALAKVEAAHAEIGRLVARSFG